MKVAVRIIGTPPVAAGIGLAGVPVVQAADPASAVLRLTELLGDPAVGVVLVEERLHDALPDDLRARLARNPIPMVVPFPGPTWVAGRDAAEAYIVELLRRAIGYRVKLT